MRARAAPAGFLLALFLSSAAARAADNLLFFKKLEAFETEQARAAADLHLTPEELKARYPPPQLGQIPVVRARPGQVVELEVPGRIPDGSFAGINCEQLEILAFEQSPTGVRAKVRLPGSLDGMVRRSCALLVCGRLTNVLAVTPVIEVAVKYVWRLDLSNGMRVVGTAVFDGERFESHAEWESHGQSAGEHGASFSMWRPGELRLYVDRTPADEAVTMATWAATPEKKERDALWGELAQLRQSERFECQGRSGCEADYDARMKGVLQRLPRIEDREREVFHKHPTACDELDLVVTPDHLVRGKAYGCADAEVADVAGRVTEEAP